jgi:hypothetical protein
MKAIHPSLVIEAIICSSQISVILPKISFMQAVIAAATVPILVSMLTMRCVSITVIC